MLPYDLIKLMDKIIKIAIPIPAIKPEETLIKLLLVINPLNWLKPSINVGIINKIAKISING